MNTPRILAPDLARAMATLRERGLGSARRELIEQVLRTMGARGAYGDATTVRDALDGYGWRRVAAPRQSLRPSWYTTHPGGNEAAAVVRWVSPRPPGSRVHPEDRKLRAKVEEEEVVRAMAELAAAGHRLVSWSQVAGRLRPPAGDRAIRRALIEAGFVRVSVQGGRTFARWVTTR